MKNSTLTGLRSAVAAGGVALLMFVAGCSGSDEAAGDDQGTTQEGEASDDAAEEGAGDQASEEDTTADEGAEDDDEPADEGPGTEDEDTEDEGSNAAAGDVAAPGDDFDPCTAITADDVNEVLGTDMGEGRAGELAGVANCTFVDVSTGDNLVVQWAPVPGNLDDALSAMAGMYSDLGEPEPVTVAGASDAAVVTAEMQGATAKLLVATADGGFIQVLSTSSDFGNDQAVQIAEATLAGA